MKYVTYDPATGALTGSYLQDLLPEHEAHHIVIDDAVSLNWPAYQANTARDGVELAPVVTPPPVVPQSVTMRQARLALFGAGVLASVETAINALPSPTKEAARIEWDYSSMVDRNRALTLTLGGALGLTDAQLDTLFITAATL